MTSFDLDPGIRPGADLFRHVNGRWLDQAQIAEDKQAAGAFIELRDASEAAIRDIVTGLTDSQSGTEAYLVEHLFGSFMDTEKVEAAGLDPLAPLLAEIDAISSIEDLLDYFGRSLRRGTGSPIGLDVDADPGDPSRYALFVGQAGLGLPDEEYYRLEQHAAVLSSYRELVDRTLTIAGLTASGGATVVELESEVAARHWDKVRTRDLRQMYNPHTPAAFDALGLPWSRVLTAAGVPAVDEVIVAQPSYFAEIAALITESRLDDWKQWCRWSLVSALSPYLPDVLVQTRFDFYGRVLQGIPQLKERWKRGVDLVERTLGEAVGKLYVQRHFPPAAKQRMDVLVANLLKAYANSIQALDWMGPETRAEALTKLDNFTPKIGFPEIWKDYSPLMIRPGDLVGNVLRAAEFAAADELSKLGGPMRRWEWLMTPQTVNAYYHPLRNEIVFPAAILQPPFFDPDADDAVNYGAIGAVIGHEIGHGFDDQGSNCDGEGRLRDWWTQADRDAFTERTGALIAQYSALHPTQLPELQVNGELTIGENIGDLGGLAIAYDAWRLAIGETEPEPVDGIAAKQRFFLSWARAWQTKRRDEALRQQIATDPHSPEEFRCNQVVRNLAPFYEAFEVTEADAAWLAPSERVKIW
ncbi:M13-type metalloendopeptidase [Propionicimonas sp.]|uniref:M13 family metallopeptidase n=1 Tax=Propionicimonas sp. TaxID=1955623 RepID=UPI00185D7125|nr:M13-type metalloendopeptidase [Propionicimonas sp.]MBU3977724.1 peptidase M13 [Actinomycetota bacterium]MBA3021647.1 peptidase M13 [Propionicimonas sp.]MBU3987198.1 peptidase M13 [Actinomycetota bacterium]MBU4009019.1 peptidase M13 [Actinomycetota bacterium]MBU4065831.1 peptidase M13 [Actinomycetota bacterium]